MVGLYIQLIFKTSPVDVDFQNASGEALLVEAAID
jgi:hypothetical protein